MAERRRTKEVRIGDVIIGGDHPIAIQSMTNTKTQKMWRQRWRRSCRLQERAGCQIIRCAVPDDGSGASTCRRSKSRFMIPLVADIHFDYRACHCGDGKRCR